MWEWRSHTLFPLTKIMYIGVKLKWTKTKKYAFDEIKRIVARNTLLTYPDFNEEFKSHTNDSNFQLGAVINQKGKPVALYSRKLTENQRMDTVTERELLSIIETIK